MLSLQQLWDLVPGESLGDKLQVISMAGGTVSLVGGLYAWHRRRKGTDIESKVEDLRTCVESNGEDLRTRFDNLEKKLLGELAAKERTLDSASNGDQSDAIYANACIMEESDTLTARGIVGWKLPPLTNQEGSSGNDLARDLSAAIDTLAAASKVCALELMETGDNSAADEALAALIAELERVRGKAAVNEAALYRQRGVLAFLRDAQLALRHYARACELDPDDAEGWNRLGHMQLRVGELDAAIASYEKVLALGNRTADKTWTAVATGNLGIVYVKKGDMPKACGHWRKARDLWREIGNPDEAAKYEGWLRDATLPT